MKTMVALLASVILSAGAYAQAPEHSGMADAKHGAGVERHIKDLHAKLAITPAEETQWNTVAQTMRDSAVEVDQAIDKRTSGVNTATAVDNLNAYGEIAQAHADSVKKLSAAFAPLYASMSEDQKKVADDVFAHRMHKRRMHSKDPS